MAALSAPNTNTDRPLGEAQRLCGAFCPSAALKSAQAGRPKCRRSASRSSKSIIESSLCYNLQRARDLTSGQRESARRSALSLGALAACSPAVGCWPCADQASKQDRASLLRQQIAARKLRPRRAAHRAEICAPRATAALLRPLLVCIMISALAIVAHQAVASEPLSTSPTAITGGGHQANLSVLCNSRCNCVILATTTAASCAGKSWPRLTNVTTKSAIPDKQQQRQQHRTETDKQQQQQEEMLQRQQLIAFSSDYSLDYEHESASSEPTQPQRPQPHRSGRTNFAGNGDDLEAPRESRPQTGSDHRPAGAGQRAAAAAEASASDQSSGGALRRPQTPGSVATTEAATAAAAAAVALQENVTTIEPGSRVAVAAAKVEAQAEANPSQAESNSGANNGTKMSAGRTQAAKIIGQQQASGASSSRARGQDDGAQPVRQRALPFGSMQLGVAPSGGQQAANFFQHHYANNNNNNPAKLMFRKVASVQQQQQQKQFFNEDDADFKVDKGRQRSAVTIGLMPGECLEQIIDLSALDFSNHRLVVQGTQKLEQIQEQKDELLAQRLSGMLTELNRAQASALSLRNNSLEFEQWTEIYALLAVHPMRRHLFQLDLSHNSLSKLGVTFTGYIEHHLLTSGSAQLNSSSQSMAGAGGIVLRWPFGRAHTYGGANQTGPLQHHEGNQSSTESRQVAAMRLVASLRHQPVLGDGRLFNLTLAKLNATHLWNQWSAQNFSLQQRADLTPLNDSSLSLDELAQQIPGRSAPLALLQLRAIDLSYNKLKWLINDQFRAIRKVQSIRLDHNKIRFIHQQAFNGLESLRYLSLSSNRLQTVYIEQFQTNYNLLALSLRSNFLAYLRAGSFAALSNLRRLDLSRNKFTILSNNAFVGLESLELLNCSSNQFVHVPSASLHPMQRLRQLDLSDNQFSQLAPGAFFHLPIEELRLNQNGQLLKIERGAFWDLPYLKRLALNSNQLLMSINSQAFVAAGQSLKTITTEDCPLLEPQARELLDNITMAATSRSLQAVAFNQLEEQKRPLETSLINPETPSLQSAEMGSNTALSAAITMTKRHQQAAHQQQMAQPQQAGASQQRSSRNGGLAGASKLLYSVCSLALVLVLLNLMLKYTSTRRYLLDARRRRRRVYQADNNEPRQRRDLESSKRSEEDDCESCDIASDSLNSTSHSARSKSSRRSSLAGCSDSMVCDSELGQTFAMCEQPHELLLMRVTGDAAGRRSASSSCDVPLLPVLPSQIRDGDVKEQTGDSELGLEEANLVLSHDGPLEADVILAQTSGNNDDGPTASINEQQLQPFTMLTDCPDCRKQSESLVAANASCCGEQPSPPSIDGAQVALEQDDQDDAPKSQSELEGRQQMNTLNLIHNQLVAAGYNYGHANCAHFYQSLEPALQFADISFVNQMEHHYY